MLRSRLSLAVAVKRGGVCGVLVCLLVAAVPAAATDTPAEAAHLLIELSPGVSSAVLARDLELPRAAVRPLAHSAPGVYVADGSVRQARDWRTWRSVTVSAERAEATLAQLQQHPGVRRAYRAAQYQAATLPTDPQFSQQLGLYNTLFPTADIQAEQAWQVTTGSSSTVIAIIDGGVDLAHEDLRDKAWLNGDEVPGNGLDDDANGFVDDANGWDFVYDRPASSAVNHATHVAGIAAANANNGVGIAGVDWGAKIMSVRVLSSTGVGFEDNIVAGIAYAVANGADVINLSLVGSDSPALLTAVENAYAAGVVVVAAAGNSGRDTTRSPVYPACADVGGVDMVIGVAATDEQGEPESFSNYGACVNIAAPGSKIVSTTVGNRYDDMTGTSMSAPFVAGAVGLYLARNPGASPAATIAAINGSAAAFSGENAATWQQQYKGLLDAARVVAAGSSSSAPTPDNQSSGSSSGDSGGGGGGGGGGGSSDPEPQPTPRVSGIISCPAAATLKPKVASAFQTVFGRKPSGVEASYWSKRVQRCEKKSLQALVGAMWFQQAHGRTYVPDKAVAGVKSPLLLTRVGTLFRTVYSRAATASELRYWQDRVRKGEKRTEETLAGAMNYHRLHGIRH